MMNSTQFDLRADGVEKEVFVDYGELYEDVRIRKGYSRKSLRHQKKVLAALPHNEADYLRDILLNFDAKEVAESVKFFLEYCIPHGSTVKAVRVGASMERFEIVVCRLPSDYEQRRRDLKAS